MTKVRTLINEDKILITAALLNVGATKVRVRKFANSFRVCIDSAFDRTDVIEALNNEGFRDVCGSPFTKFSFNQPHEIFVHRMVA